MLTRIKGGRLHDPLNRVDGEVRDLWVEGSRFVAPPADGRAPDATVDLAGRVVMPAGIDLHSHIGGGKVNIARLLMADEHRDIVQAAEGACRCGSGHSSPSTFTTGYAYARLGYTMAFEPAMLGANARQTHLEMADIPVLDKGAYVLLGNDDLLLGALAQGGQTDFIRDYVAWTLRATQSIAIKVVNPGGISAFKWGARTFDLDEPNPRYGVTARAILTSIADALTELGVPHPVHVHGCNLGVPGGEATTRATIAGMEGRPIHLTHLQFHAYGAEGDHGFSSGAPGIADLVNRSPNVSVDVGQVMFGQTVTASGDTMSQVRNARFGDPKKWVAMDIECEAGCGVVPFRYRHRNVVNALQWAIGLELFLLIRDPWRLALTTDHPNGAPFTTYPHLIRLLMDRTFRDANLATLPKAARAATSLGTIDREYTLQEIAILTRAGPARLLGIEREHGHLGAGAVADLTAYEDDPADRERMFGAPALVLKGGRAIVRDGRLLDDAAESWGAVHTVRPAYDRGAERRIREHLEGVRGMRLGTYVLSEEELAADGRASVLCHACGGGAP